MKSTATLTAGLLAGNTRSLGSTILQIPVCFWLNVTFKQTFKQRTACVFSLLWCCWLDCEFNWGSSSIPELYGSMWKSVVFHVQHKENHDKALNWVWSVSEDQGFMNCRYCYLGDVCLWSNSVNCGFVTPQPQLQNLSSTHSSDTKNFF